MSSEIVVPETPNWLQELEAKREKRLKARLGHEAGAGAPCLKCGEKCPGLDLHFWRKCCKVCKCSKEEHEVQDDDIYGWAQFQLLGSKPSKTKQKIVLPGKRDEIDLDWAPKGNKETVDKYLKTLPPEQLPVTGSQAARDRKQLLQKQIPIHDIDPNLCHELNEEELKQMNEYIAHVKQNSVGIGQIVSLSNIIKGNLHMLSPADAEIIAKRYAKGIPLSEIVKLQAQRMAGSLKHPELSQNLEELSLNNKNLPNYSPNTLSQAEDMANSVVSEKIHDRSYSAYGTESTRVLPATLFSSGMGPQSYNKNKYLPSERDQAPIDTTLDEKYLPNPNFDPKKRPSQFNPQFLPYQSYARQNLSFGENDAKYEPGNSAFVPYKNTSNINHPSNQQNNLASLGNPADVQFPPGNSNIPYGREATPTQRENQEGSRGAAHQQYPQPLSKQNTNDLVRYGDDMPASDRIYENVDDLRKRPETLPSYVPGKYNIVAENQFPATLPKNIKDLAFSTHESDFQYGQYRQPGSYPTTDLSSDPGFRPIQTADNQQIPSKSSAFPHFNLPYSRTPQKPGANAPNATDSQAVRDLPGATLNAAIEELGGRQSSAAHDRPYSNLPSGWGTPLKAGSHPFKPPQDANSLRPAEDLNATDPQIIHNLSAAPSVLSPDQGRPYSNLPNAFKPPHDANSLRPAEDWNATDPQIIHNLTAAPSVLSPDQGRPYSNLPNSWKTPQKPTSNAFKPTHDANSPRSTEDLNATDPQNLSAAPSAVPPGHSRPYSDHPWAPQPNSESLKPGGRLSEMLPARIASSEDFLQPSQVNIGPIRDVDYPEIRAAVHGTNDFCEDYSPESIREIINNVKLPDCRRCKKPFEEEEFAVAIDRAKALFHAGCFKCAGCNQVLADNVYFYHKESDNVYCLRDYAKIRGFPRCKACDELIFTKEYCLADNATFHLKHFCCTECDEPLAGRDYTVEEEMPYCLPCFEQSKASRCSSCGRVIKPDERGCTLNGVHFHAVDGCFACQVCGKPLMGKKLLLRNDKLYCSHECHQAAK